MQDSSLYSSLSLFPLDFGAVKLTYSCCVCMRYGPGLYLNFLLLFTCFPFFCGLFVYFSFGQNCCAAEARNEFTLWGV